MSKSPFENERPEYKTWRIVVRYYSGCSLEGFRMLPPTSSDRKRRPTKRQRAKRETEKENYVKLFGAELDRRRKEVRPEDEMRRIDRILSDDALKTFLSEISLKTEILSVEEI